MRERGGLVVSGDSVLSVNGDIVLEKFALICILPYILICMATPLSKRAWSEIEVGYLGRSGACVVRWSDDGLLWNVVFSPPKVVLL